MRSPFKFWSAGQSVKQVNKNSSSVILINGAIILIVLVSILEVCWNVCISMHSLGALMKFGGNVFDVFGHCPSYHESTPSLSLPSSPLPCIRPPWPLRDQQGRSHASLHVLWDFRGLLAFDFFNPHPSGMERHKGKLLVTKWWWLEPQVNSMIQFGDVELQPELWCHLLSSNPRPCPFLLLCDNNSKVMCAQVPYGL